MGPTETGPDHTEGHTTTYQAYFTNHSSPWHSHTSKVFLPKSIWNELTDKVRKLIITHNKNVANSSPSSQATWSPQSHTSAISIIPVINHHMKVHEVEELSDTPSAESPTEDHQQEPRLTLVHDSLNQYEITDSSDIAQILSVNKSTNQ